MPSSKPNEDRLFQIASQQAGYFTARQARDCGYSWALLSHHVQGGRFLRERRGLYRLQQFPSSPREEVVAAWLAVGPDEAVVSHESALDLLGLSDVVPGTIHLTVPRSKRPRHPTPQGVTVHTTTRPLGPGDVVLRGGVRVTAPARSIVDAAQAGTAPEQIVLAVEQAVRRGMTTRARLLGETDGRSKRVERLIRQAIEEAPPQ